MSNTPPRKPLISTKWLFVLGLGFVAFGVIMVVFFPHVK
jgi:hypothetical protein